MLERILSFSIKQRWLVLLASLGIALLGAYNYNLLPIDAVPDITNVQVQINTEAPGYSPLEAEQRITFPVETAMAGLPNLDYTRSLSRYGLSQVTVVFKDGTDIFWARNLINERIQEAKSKLPPGVEVAMGPIATGLGEIYMFTVEAKAGAKTADGKAYTPMDLRRGGLDHQTPTPQSARCRRGEHHRRFREAISRHAASRQTARLRFEFARRDGSTRAQQRERRRGLHRAQRRAIPHPHARPGWRP
jgi:hypothetical protein